MLLWGVALLNYMDRQMLATMKPAMMTTFAELESAANFGRLMAIFLWIYALFRDDFDSALYWIDFPVFYLV